MKLCKRNNHEHNDAVLFYTCTNICTLLTSNNKYGTNYATKLNSTCDDDY